MRFSAHHHNFTVIFQTLIPQKGVALRHISACYYWTLTENVLFKASPSQLTLCDKSSSRSLKTINAMILRIANHRLNVMNVYTF